MTDLGVPEISFLFQTIILCPEDLGDKAEFNRFSLLDWFLSLEGLYDGTRRKENNFVQGQSQDSGCECQANKVSVFNH